jgi:hypothetical protein
MLSVKEFQMAMDKMEEYRINLLEMECAERQLTCDKTSCVRCVLSEDKKRRQLRKPKVNSCDVCGNPVCRKHRDAPSKESGQHFVMCLDCKDDLEFESLDIHNDNLHDKLVRLLTSYDRMVLQLSFCVSAICTDVATKLSSLETKHSKVRIGTSAASFVSGGLAVAGTLSLLTPAGIPLIGKCALRLLKYCGVSIHPAHMIIWSRSVAAIATSSASTAVNVGNSAITQSSAKEASQVADRIIGWHRLCLGILAALARLREVLIKEPLLRKDYLKMVCKAGKPGWNKSVNGASRATSLGLRATSVVASTPATTYSSLLQTSLAVTPVVGAALSLGIMACDAHNIQATIRNLQKPSDMALALMQIQKTFTVLIPTSVEDEALLLLQVVRELSWLQKSVNQLDETKLVSDSSGHSASPRTSLHDGIYLDSILDATTSGMDALSLDGLHSSHANDSGFTSGLSIPESQKVPTAGPTRPVFSSNGDISSSSSESSFVTPNGSFDDEEKKDTIEDMRV